MPDPRSRLARLLCRAAALAGVLLAASVAPAAPLKLEKDDHICVIGNTLAERLQHDGWLDALLHSRFPQHDLVIRHLGYSGDELNTRLRSMDFGKPDEWLSGVSPIPQPGKLTDETKKIVRENRFELTNTKADVVFAFFGYNESFAGPEGLPKFREDLANFVRHTLAQKYNGTSAPRLVLFSPIAHEDLLNPNLPDGQANNARLALYTQAMADVAAQFPQITFVDLFTPSDGLFRQQKTLRDAKPLTINGIHLNAKGNELVSRAIDRALFGPAPAIDDARLEKLRAAVRDRNFHWYNRYRVTDGYSTYGDRAFLNFANKQSNYEVGQRELEVLDVLTANRDKQIWALAKGQDYKLDDSNTPEFLKVETNKPGPLPGGKHEKLGGEEAIAKMTVHPKLQVNLFASEEMFPELISPVQMAFDTKGRLWVATWPSYPHWKPKDPMNDSLLILEDTNGDGKADKCTTFAGDLHNPTGFEFWGGGVIVAQGPDILFLKDTNGDDHYDVKERMLHGLDTADTHHTSNSFTLDPGGALYFQEGTFHHTQVESPWGPAVRVANGAVFRYEPRAQKFDVYVSHGFANPHGHVFDKWGQDIVVDGTGANPYHGALFSGHVDFPNKHARPPQVYQQRTRPCPGMEFLSSGHFPEEFRGNLLVGNVIGFQGILNYKVEDAGSTFSAKELEPIVSSTDPNFRPVDFETAPDGSFYFTDWYNPIIGHLQHNLRDPSRNKTNGRVYRVTAKGRDLLKPLPVAGQSVDALLKLLEEEDDRVRYRARIELSARPTPEVITATDRWVASFANSRNPNVEHLMLEALWVKQHHNAVDLSHLLRVLSSPDFRARAAATRVLCYWRDRIPNPLPLVVRLAGDSHPRVRLEAVRAASFFPAPEAYEAVIVAGDLPSDVGLDFIRNETSRVLEPLVKNAIAAGRRPAFATPAGARYLLSSLSNAELLAQPRNPAVFTEMLFRPGLPELARREAVAGLAQTTGRTELQVVMDSIRTLDAREGSVDTTVIFDLVRLLTGRGTAELAAARAELERLATTARQPVFRQIGFVSLINVDGNAEQAWALAVKSPKQLLDFVSAVPMIADPGVRGSLYDRLAGLLKELPGSLKGATQDGPEGRFVRIELPRRGTLTLAEVEVYSGDANVARGGKASQKNTGAGGEPARGIDGNTSPDYNDGGQTHTQENTENPWWEVDLGEERPISRIKVYNRDGFQQRLEGFTIRVLDGQRNETFKQEKIPAPKRDATFELTGGGSGTLVRRAAMNALTQIRGKELDTFNLLAPLVLQGDDRISAVRALQKIPRGAWPKEQAEPLLKVLTESVRKMPVADRTNPTAVDTLVFADALTSLLPADRARQMRKELSDLGVRVIRVGTVFEKMSYDKDILVVQAGKPVEFLFENSDLMPHNFVVTRPGAMEEVGQTAEANAQKPGFAERQYVPDSKAVLLGSRLLQPREAQKISFTAPKEAGVYPYVCTYPGHWRRMYGALYVVDDLEDYFANPEGYLASHNVKVEDELLADRRPRTEWKLEDLAQDAARLGAGRDFGNGRQMFKVANCIGCHKMDGQGNEFGPDLTKLDAKLVKVELLRHILLPSEKIDEKYQMVTVTTDAGKAITGMIVGETKDAIRLIENPLAKADPVEIPKSEIDERVKSPVSLMPKGLLDKLTKDEVLDLLAYVQSKGDKDSALFKSTGHDH